MAATVREGFMAFETPTDRSNNRGLVTDPAGFARERGAASWLYLNGEEFASMDGGMSYADVQAAVAESARRVRSSTRDDHGPRPTAHQGTRCTPSPDPREPPGWATLIRRHLPVCRP